MGQREKEPWRRSELESELLHTIINNEHWTRSKQSLSESDKKCVESGKISVEDFFHTPMQKEEGQNWADDTTKKDLRCMTSVATQNVHIKDNSEVIKWCRWRAQKELSFDGYQMQRRSVNKGGENLLYTPRNIEHRNNQITLSTGELT